MLFVLAVGATGGMIGFSMLVGKKGRTSKIKDTAYECGMLPIGDGNTRMSVKFYLVAMLFILFDIEVVFMYPWAVNFKTMIHTHGSTIFWSMAGFISLVTVGYIYAIKKGVLDWKKS
jgi:NADH-quinone oxidoreductase subunit A